MFSIRPDLLAVEEDFVLVSLSCLQLCDPYQGVVMALDLEGACSVAENLDLAGGVGLDPDCCVALAGITEEGTEDETGPHARPTSRAITVMPNVISTTPITSKTMPERIILVMGIMPEP